jgi:hypothetical protein
VPCIIYKYHGGPQPEGQSRTLVSRGPSHDCEIDLSRLFVYEYRDENKVSVLFLFFEGQVHLISNTGPFGSNSESLNRLPRDLQNGPTKRSALAR